MKKKSQSKPKMELKVSMLVNGKEIAGVTSDGDELMSKLRNCEERDAHFVRMFDELLLGIINHEEHSE